MTFKIKLLLGSLLLIWSLSILNSAFAADATDNTDTWQQVININEILDDTNVDELTAETTNNKTTTNTGETTNNTTTNINKIKVTSTGAWPTDDEVVNIDEPLETNTGNNNEKVINIDEPLNVNMENENTDEKTIKINEKYSEDMKVAQENKKKVYDTSTGVENYLLFAILLIIAVFGLKKKFL